MREITPEQLTKIEEAILFLADMMENPMHDEYRIHGQILEILGIKFKEETK